MTSTSTAATITPAEAVAVVAAALAETDDFALVLIAVEIMAEQGRDDVANAICTAFELCPVHTCDAEICRDDQVEECREARNA